MTLTIREFDVKRDAATVAKMFTWNDHFTWNEADIVANVARFPEGKPMYRIVVESSGEAVGYGRACLIAPNPRGSFACEVLVMPENQRRGVGREIVTRLEAFAKESGAKCAQFMVYEWQAGSLVAAEKFGYRKETLYFQSVIDPRRFDLGAFEPQLATVRSKGYELKALAELPVCDETDRNYYAAVHASDKDAPFMDYFGWPNYEEFRRMTMGAAWFDRSGIAVAMKDGQIVGVSSVNKGSVNFNGEMFIDYTGVLREHRGQGLATAMKAMATDYAKTVGGTILRTENNIGNPAMRAVNKKLGFEERPGMWMVVKEL